MNSNTERVKSGVEAAKGSIKETAGTLVGDETLEAKGSIEKNLGKNQTKRGDAKESFAYNVVAICPRFSEVGDILRLLKNQGFADDQVSLLGREQAGWQENLGREWQANQTAKGAKAALVGGALGALPGLALVAGIALTGGAGLLAAGPLFGALSALGMGSLAGGLMGASSGTVDTPLNVEEEVANAIGLGQWAIVVHCRTDAEAARVQGLLPNRRIVRENEPKAVTPPDLVAAQQVDMNKLAAAVEEAFLPVKKISQLPLEEVMCNIETIDDPELKQAAHESVKKIATATGLTASQITQVFKDNRFANTNIVGQLYEQSGANRRKP